MSIKVINADVIDPDDKRQQFFILAGDYWTYAVYRGAGIWCAQDALDELADYAAEHAPGIMGSIEGEETDHVKELRADGIADGHENEGDGFISDYYVRAGDCGDWIELPAAIELLTAEEIKAKYDEELDITGGK